MSNSTDQPAPEGLPEAHTRAAAPGEIDLAASVARIAAELAAPDGEQGDLLAGSPDIDDESTGLARAANKVATARRGRGRPPGSSNKRNALVFDYLEQLGHRDPAVTLSMIQSADTKALAQALGLDTPKGRASIFAVQRQAAADLMPYKYAKKPQAIAFDPSSDVRPMMVIGDVVNIQQVAGDAVMSVDGGAKKPNEINASAVRHEAAKSHGEQDANDINTIDGETN